MAEITSSNPIAEAKAKSMAADGVKHKRGQKPSAKSKLLYELDNCGAQAKQFSNILTQHKIEHSIPQGKALGCCLTEYGKLKIMVKKLMANVFMWAQPCECYIHKCKNISVG